MTEKFTGKQVAQIWSHLPLDDEDYQSLPPFDLVPQEMQELLEQEQADWWYEFDHNWNKLIIQYFWNKNC